MQYMILILSAANDKPIAYVDADTYARLSLASVANTRVRMVLVASDDWSTDVPR